MFAKILLGLLVVQALFLIATMIYIARSIHFEDRVVGTNLVGTIGLNFIAMLSVYMGEGFGLDIALVYAFLAFLSVVVLCRLLGVQNVERRLEAEEEAAAQAKQAAQEAKHKKNAAAQAAARQMREAESEKLRRQLEALRSTPPEGGGDQ